MLSNDCDRVSNVKYQIVFDYLKCVKKLHTALLKSLITVKFTLIELLAAINGLIYAKSSSKRPIPFKWPTLCLVNMVMQCF